jgi:hypothetical protein
MTTKAELQKQINELQAKLDALPDDKPTGRWKPEDGEEYWVNDFGLAVCGIWKNTCGDDKAYALANVYRTEEEVQTAIDQQLATVRVLDRIAELNAEQGWVCDLDDYRQDRYTFYYNLEVKELDSFDENSEPSHPPQRYGSKQTIETVIKEMGSDCLLMLGVSGVAE